MPDGRVESVEGGAPLALRGRLLAEDEEVPLALRAVARALLDGPAEGAYLRRKRVAIEHGGRSVHAEVVLLEALPLRRAYVPVSQLLLRTLDAFVLQARGDEIDLRVEQAPDVPAALYLDGEKIAWVVATLVGNALRYTGARSPKPGHVHVKISWQDAGDELVIRVSDNGPGMPAGRARWLFERDPATGAAAGLALLMVRDVMVAHRGSVAVESALGRGTTFTLRIPRTRPRGE